MTSKKADKSSKVFNLKKCVTITEAAKYLSQILAEEVVEAEILLFALEGHLKLSVEFVNSTSGYRGKVVPGENVENERQDDCFPDSVDGEGKDTGSVEELKRKTTKNTDYKEIQKIEKLCAPERDVDLSIIFEDEVTEITGVWDLPMIGSEYYDIKSRYMSLIDGPEIKSFSPNGVLIEGENGQFYRVLQCVVVGDVLKTSTQKRLPGDCLILLRTTSLLEFQEMLQGHAISCAKNIDDRKESTYLSIIGALLEIFMDRYKVEKFPTEEELRNYIDDMYNGIYGLSENNLGHKFAEAKKFLDRKKSEL